MTIKRIRSYTIKAPADIVRGDEILFVEKVWGGSHRNRKLLGERRVAARVEKESYSALGQHTFTLVVTGSDGFRPLRAGERILRKGRNIYGNTTKMRPTAECDREKRRAIAEEKHGRGEKAREDARLIREFYS